MASRVVIVTGAANGIGAALVRRLLFGGDSVVAVDVDAAGLAILENEGLGGSIRTVASDVASVDGPARAVDAAINEFGTLTGVVLNAAVLRSALLEDFQSQDWRQVLEVNLISSARLISLAIPHLRDAADPAVVLTASTGAVRGQPGLGAYGASKAALIQLVRTAAVELGRDRIRVNAVSPGWIETSMNDAFWSSQADVLAAERDLLRLIPLGRQGKPDEVAGALDFLLSTDASYITGTTLFVDGGYTAN